MWPHAKAPWPCQEEREGGEVVVVPMMRPRPEWGFTEHCRQWPFLVTDRGTALLSGRNMAPSCQDEWYQEIDKRYSCSLYATKRMFAKPKGNTASLLLSGQWAAALSAGRLRDSTFRDAGRPGAVPHVGPFWWEVCPDSWTGALSPIRRGNSVRPDQVGAVDRDTRGWNR